jgi:hypothetical protein
MRRGGVVLFLLCGLLAVGATAAVLTGVAADERCEQMYESASEDVQGAYDELQEQVERPW